MERIRFLVFFCVFTLLFVGCVGTEVPSYDAGVTDKEVNESPISVGRWYVKSKGVEEDEAKTWSFDVQPSVDGKKYIRCFFLEALLINKDAKKAWTVSVRHSKLPFTTLGIDENNRIYWKYADSRSNLTFELVGEFLTPTTLQGTITIEDVNEGVKGKAELQFEGSVGVASQEAEDSVKAFCAECYKDEACTK